MTNAAVASKALLWRGEAVQCFPSSTQADIHTTCHLAGIISIILQAPTSGLPRHHQTGQP